MMIAILLVSGCMDAPPDYSTLLTAGLVTGSSSIVTSADGRWQWVVRPDEGSVSLLDGRSRSSATTVIGAEPWSIAATGDETWVTLRGEHAVAVLVAREDRGGGAVPEEIGRLETGAEPSGIVMRSDGLRAYIALASEGQVIEVDTETVTATRAWSVAGEPNWLALRPDGDALYVGSQYGATLRWIDVGQDDATVHDLPLPEKPDATRRGLVATRVTGSPAVSPDGTTLVVPLLHEDNVTLVAPAYYASSDSQPRFDPALAFLPLGDDGAPDPAGASVVQVVGQRVRTTGRAVETPDDASVVSLRSYLSSTAFGPAGNVVYAAMEGSAAVLAVQVPPAGEGELISSGSSGRSPDADRERHTPTITVTTASGPRGLALDATAGVHVDAWLDDTVNEIEPAGVLDALTAAQAGDTTFELTADRTLPLPASALTDAQVRGRRFFYSATDVTVSASGSGVSCATCHFQRRTDGLDWPLAAGEKGLRNTPSLAGSLAETAPYTWGGAVPDVATEAMLTSRERMGGQSLDLPAASRIAEYLLSRPSPDPARNGRDPAAIERGGALFVAVGCAVCHGGPGYTNGLREPAFGGTMDVPTLVGVSLTAPYRHDGALPTLSDVLDGAAAGQMGAPFVLGDAERHDLEAFVRSL